MRRPRLRVAGIRLSVLVNLYRWHLTRHKTQELLAAAGIAVGVALVFGVLIANSSLVGSDRQLVKSVVGDADFQVSARSSDGFSEDVATQISDLRGVTAAAAVLRVNALLIGPHGRVTVQLFGISPSQLQLHGTVTAALGRGVLLLAHGLGLPSEIAQAVGVQAEHRVTVVAAGKAHSVPVRAVLDSQTVGLIASSPIAVSLLSFVQRLTGQPRTVTQVLVAANPGDTQLVRAELARVDAGRLSVQPATHEVAVLNATARPTSESTALFAVVSAITGLLLALNAMLLVVPERRRLVLDLRQQGYTSRQILVILGSQAACLGIVASLVGVALGDLLSHWLFGQVPDYLTAAFPIGNQPTISATAVLLAVGSGTLTAIIASLLPLADLRGAEPNGPRGRSREAGQAIGGRTILRGALAGVVLVVALTGVVVWAPGLSVAACAALAPAAFVLILPLYSLITRLGRAVAERRRNSMLGLALMELDATATRSVAFAGIVAIAVYGMVAVQGARRDLVNGLDLAVTQYLDTAQIWVTADQNFLTIDRFPATPTVNEIRRVPSVASVRTYQGDLLDIGSRLLWIRARPTADVSLLQASQVLHGNVPEAEHRLREDGWAAVSSSLANEQHAKLGDTVSLPTPSGPARLRVAAITTNAGWPPGAITLNTNDFARLWQTTTPTGLEIGLKPGVNPATAARQIRNALGLDNHLLVQTTAEREGTFKASARQGIAGLTDISTLLLIATSLAIAAGLSASVLQRRARLASLKVDGFDSRQLWRSLLLESGILIAIGCLDGAILGIYGHAIASRWLRESVGFPTPFSLGLDTVILTLIIVAIVTFAVISLPGLRAARVPAEASFHD
jgi:putative ABC transport system permease protein